MKPSIFYFSLLILGFICPNITMAQSDLEGTWIGAYRTDYTNGSPSQSLLRFLIDFRGNQVTFRALPYPQSGQPGSVAENPFVRNGDTIIIQEPEGPNTMILTYVGDDRFEYYHEGFESTVYTFRKLRSEPVISESHLTGNAFVMLRNGNQLVDTVEFVNDSLLVYYSQLGKEQNASPWKLNYFDNYSFLLFDQALIPPYVVQSVSKEVIHLALEYIQTIPLQLKPIERTNHPDLDGQWYLSSRAIDGEQTFYIGPAQTDGGLAVKEDIMTIQLDGNQKTRRWKSSATGQYIFFPTGKSYTLESWKVLEWKSDKLRIEQTISFSPRRTEILEFTKHR